ncbi:MAG: tRNA (adenosine(37)-N6)-dimethylallyltransferase MiaA, partial [Alkalinema sp. CAN_BIN05]|nr:tRNA (adenosine(37)-N6)-dimethylallyltransferase MiaA [Alkalinema sp. CAN_BIN05]
MIDDVTDDVTVNQDWGPIVQAATPRHNPLNNSNVLDEIVPEFPRGLVTICGATATGKSGLGIAVARELGSIIISADSRQIYREFDIGSAKVTQAEMAGIPHYLVDAYDPTETVSAAMFQDQANQILSKATLPSDVPSALPLLVGGTGLYLRAITHGMQIPRVRQHRELRSQLEALGQGLCYQLLQHLDPKACLKIHGNDRIRTVRALEVFYVTGIPMSDQQGEIPPNYPILQIGLKSECLNDRIVRRTRQMFELGFMDEVQNLVAKYGDDLPLLNTLGYQEVRQYLRGEITLEESESLTVMHTRQFAKRQRTWF